MPDKHASVLDFLHDAAPSVSAELRPPKSGLGSAAGMDSWIDMQQTARRLTRAGALIFLTDNAVGDAEEENLNHLAANLAGDIAPSVLVPFLTTKHSLDYCLTYASRAAALGVEAKRLPPFDASP